MTISKVKIVNFKCFQGAYEIELNDGLNILVGNNEAGKSTILEAIYLALTGYFNGRNIKNELSQYIFNRTTTENYLEAINKGEKVAPPYILIEVYFKGSDCPLFEGNGNSERNKAQGIALKIEFDERYTPEYNLLIAHDQILSLPIEYYNVIWECFARHPITSKSIPIKCALIDSSSSRLYNGSDIYISRIVKGFLDVDDVTYVSQAHRRMKENFMRDPSIKRINDKINQESSLIKKKVELSVELGTKGAWENSLVTQLDSVPFGFIGKGEQCVVKTELALSHKKAQEANLILIEEPECHLSYSRLNEMICAIEEKYTDKQILISTHNSFVANKLGLDNLILIDSGRTIRFGSLNSNDYFRKIAGYDTLRLILCKKAILVEGASDELIVQKAYMLQNDGHLPIQDGIDIISVGTAFLRFLEISDILKKPTIVVTDSDGDLDSLYQKYENYIGVNKKTHITICYDSSIDTGDLRIGNSPYNYNTLEPKILKSNSLDFLNSIFETKYETEDELRKYMFHNKTDCALRIFNSDKGISFPEYIMEAVKFCE